MNLPLRRGRSVLPPHGILGAVLIVVGEILIAVRDRPVSDFYFPFVWLGYVLLLDGAVHRQTGTSIFMTSRKHFLAMLPISAAFWWVFEAFNLAVHNWDYIGTAPYSGFGYIAFASIDFATVLLAVWTSALFVAALLPTRKPTAPSDAVRVEAWIPAAMFGAGIACMILPILWPRYVFGMIWLCMFLLLDPINDRLGRPSIIRAVAAHEWRLPASFALGGLMCGFFWEAWNYWSMPKWVYTIPYVNHWHIFEMPLLGWSGYLPFGLELFAMGNFVFPLLRLRPFGLTPPTEDAESPASRRLAS